MIRAIIRAQQTITETTMTGTTRTIVTTTDLTAPIRRDLHMELDEMTADLVAVATEKEDTVVETPIATDDTKKNPRRKNLIQITTATTVTKSTVIKILNYKMFI